MTSTGFDELFTCSGCGDGIGTERARILCKVCANFNLCANCYVINYSSNSHNKSHATTVFRNSGYVGFENSKATSEPPGNSGNNSRKPSEETPRKISEIPTANWGALWSVMKAPLVKKDKRATKSVGRIETSILEDARYKNDLLSPLSGIPELRSSPSMRKSIGTPGYPGPIYFRPDKWEPFFESNSTPSSIFVGLMSLIFNMLDERGTGYLKPEIYSSFLEMQGYPLSANIWKMACTKAAGASSKDVADLELGLYFSKRSISHTLTSRPAEPESKVGNSLKKIASSDDSKKINSKHVNQSMPLLSRQGFIDLCASEYLKDPSMAYQYLMNALQELKVWKELGDLPRSVLPSTPINPQSQDQDKTSKATPVVKLKSEERKLLEYELQGYSVNAKPKINQTGNSNKTIPKSAFLQMKAGETEPPPVSPTFIIKFQDASLIEPRSNSRTFRNTTPRKRDSTLFHNQKKLEIKTNFSGQWLHTASAMSARSPQPRKVETLIEAYEHVRRNSICLDERKNYK